MAIDYVKFQRGSQLAYDKLISKNRVDDNTLYFIYPDDNSAVGKLYLGTKLISGGDVVLTSASLSDLSDVLAESIKENSFLIQNAEGKWDNVALADVADLLKTQFEFMPEIQVEDDDVVILELNDNKIVASHAMVGPADGTTKGAAADASISAFGESLEIKVPLITVDKYGHTTAIDEKILSITLPEIPEYVDTDTTYTLEYKTFEDESKAICLYDNDGSLVSSIDASDFIKDGMLEDVSYNEDTNELTFVWNTASGKTSDIVKLTDLLEPYEAGNGINIDGNVIEIKLANIEKNLVLNENGLSTNFDLANYITGEEAKVNNGIRFINQEEINKLSALSLNGEDITISGTVEASQVKNLYDLVKKIIISTTSEDLDLFTDGIQSGLGIEVGAQKNFISSVDENNFTVTEGKLILAKDYVTTAIYDSQIGDLTQLIRNGDFSQFTYNSEDKTTLVNEINYINERLTWGEMVN